MKTKNIIIILLIFVFSVCLSNSVNALSLYSRVTGRILLQVQEHGEAWYVNPNNGTRYLLGRPADAFDIMRNLGLGISNADLSKIPTEDESFAGDKTLRNRLEGKILLQIESHGEAWYVYPGDLKRYYLGRPADAFRIMRELGLGITNADLKNIPANLEEAPDAGPEEVPTTPEEPDILLPVAVLEEKIPEAKDYPKLKQIFVDLYGPEFTPEEVEFMKAGLNIYKEKPELKGYTKEVLYYIMSWHFEYDQIDAGYFNQAIIPLAKDITKGAENDMARVKAIQEWVDTNIIYSFYASPDTLKDMLEKKTGKCAHYSKLIIALCRAIGIPARGARHTIVHGWEEVYVNGDWLAIPSTGYLDYNYDGVIELSDLLAHKKDKMVDVFVGSPLGEGDRSDMTFGYNKYIVERIIKEAEKILDERYYSEAEYNIEEAKKLLSSWEKENSVEKRNIIGKEAMEYTLLAIAVMREDAAPEEVTVAFLEDFPLFKAKRIDFVNGSESLVTNSINANTKILYIFDAIADLPEISIEYMGEFPFINFSAALIARDFAKERDISIKLAFINDNTPPRIEFWDEEEIEALSDFKDFLDSGKARDFIRSFGDSIDSVKNGIVDKTTFDLPQKLGGNDYYITAGGGVEYEGTEVLGYTIRPFILIVKNKIGELLLKKELPLIQKIYTNLIIVNESDEIVKPEKKNGEYYYFECPSNFVNFASGQILEIERSGDFVKITETGGD